MSRLPPDFVAGVRDAVPIQVGLTPYGLIVGIAAIRVGLTADQAVGFSAAVFAGAAQLAAIDLLDSGAPLVVVVLTAAVINLRIMMFSASLAPYFESYSLRRRAALAAVLVGMAYARAIAEFQGEDPPEPAAYYLGVSLSLYAVWITTTAAGAAVGAGIPEGLSIGFVVPLVFLAMAVSAVEDRPTLVAAAVGGGGAALVAGLPMRLNLVVACVAGVAAGLAVEGFTGATRDEDDPDPGDADGTAEPTDPTAPAEDVGSGDRPGGEP